ncbi:MAG: hypothetical protein NDI61_02775 [Bdellovibrionaceae bacterium]|nr:hypothetical protein [Pseudobdellovibrionaceae bacterium]
MSSTQSSTRAAEEERNVDQQDARELVDWYKTVRRDLPWRLNRDPYRIWISEVMLQQTTVAAVIPYYEKFLERFPNLSALASSPVEDVLAQWAGLGYYSRARNLHKSAQALEERGGFPETWQELIELPGFGPYTARAVASLAFDQKTGVLDGNVIRLLTRRHGLSVEWWKPQGRTPLQDLADRVAMSTNAPADLNQGLMELGATICTPQNPACMICPWSARCVARQTKRTDVLPLKKPRREREIWVWRPYVIAKRGRVALIENEYAPFLKGHWITPGRAQRVTTAPKRFDYRHSVTHHDIFVIVDQRADVSTGVASQAKWVPLSDLKKWVPTTLVRRAIEQSSKTQISSARRSQAGLILTGLVMAMSLSCTSAPKPYNPETPASSPTPIASSNGETLLAQPLTQDGDNFRPIFSPDGKKVYFISENREAHQHQQAYEVDLATRVERRITYQDGDVSSVAVTPDGKSLIYASATDEIKEDPFFVNDLRNRYTPPEGPTSVSPAPTTDSTNTTDDPPPPRLIGLLESRQPTHCELYETRVDGTNIRRLTKSHGFDGEPALGGKGRHLIFSSEKNGNRDLYGLQLGNAGLRRLTSGPLRDIQPTVTPSGKYLAWVQLAADFTTSQIHVSDGSSYATAPLTNKAALNVTPFWHPNGQEFVFASNRGDGKTFDLFSVDRKGTCLKRLTESSSHETYPAFSPDGRWIVFSSNHSGRFQIYLMEHRPPPICLTDLP